MLFRSKLFTRTLSGAVFVVLLIGCIWPGFQSNPSPMAFFILFAVIPTIGSNEFFRMGKKLGLAPQSLLGVVVGLSLYYYFVHIAIFDYERLLIDPFLALIILLCGAIFLRELFRKSETPFQNIAYTFLGIIYVFMPFCLLVDISFFRHYYEPRIILGIFFLIWANDTFAYLVGSLIGKTKLLERISPGKTWEGFAGGGIATLILA